MSEVSTGEPKQVEQRDTASLSRQVDELIPILAHGFTQEIEDRGLRGKVQLHAVAGDRWAVGTSQDNKYGVPNVITYPQDYLAKTDLRVVNARLRHEIGNLNYPFEKQLTELSAWAREQGIPPQIVTTLAQAIHGPSVDYLEMRNSHSSAPQDNLRAMYETEVDVHKLAAGIGERAPYRQVLDVAFLEGLSTAGIIPREVVDTALQNVDPKVRAVITPELEEQIAEAVKTSNPRRKAAMIRDSLFPQLAELATINDQLDQGVIDDKDQLQHLQERLKQLSGEQATSESTDTSLQEISQENKNIPSNRDLETQMQQMREQLQKIKQQIQKKSEEQHESNRPQQQDQSERQKGQQSSQKEMSLEEQQEQRQAKNLLEDTLRERLQDIKDQMQQQDQQPSAQKQETTPQSMQEIGEQAQQMKEQLEQKLQDTQASQDEQIADHLEKLKEQLQQLEEVAKQLSEDQQGQVEEAEDEEPMTYNIKEYGIDESKLSDEQLELLGKVRTYAQKTSKTYRTAMRVLMTAYQQHNPNFTDEMIQKMKERGYDLPDFSIYSQEAAQQFLSKQAELGIDSVQAEDFLVNFNLPRPIGRMWYRGGDGKLSLPVPEGEIEWGEFYRRTMPVIWNAADRAAMTEKLYLDRLNQFGQHDAKKYYYLYEAANITAPDSQTDQMDQPADQSDSQQSESQEIQSEKVAKGQELGESGSQSDGEQQEQSHEAFQPGGSSNEKALQDLFSKNNSHLLNQLEDLSSQLTSKFTEQKEANFSLRKSDESIGERVSYQQQKLLTQTQAAQIAELERIKNEQQNELTKLYQETSGLDGQALALYVEYMVDMEDFIDDVSKYFTNRFKLDQDYQMTPDQLHGSRLQKGWQENIMGKKDGKALLKPASFERRFKPDKPTILWTLIIDNSGSCDGQTIEEEKKLAVGLIEVSKKLNIPLEILTFGGPNNFTFLKTHDQEVFGEDLQKTVLLQADQGTPDVETLEGACASMRTFSDQHRTPHSFVYFMTDGQSGGDGRTIEDVIKDYRRNMVITGIGLGEAAGTIQTTWGKNALPVPDVKRLSQQFLDKIEEQIEETFD